MSTGPQTTLIEPASEDHSDDTRGYVAREAAQRRAEVAAAIHTHRKTGVVARLRGAFRGHPDIPVPPDADEPGEFTDAIAEYGDSPDPWTRGVLQRPVPEAVREDCDPEPTMAVRATDLADDLPAEAPGPRPFAPENAPFVVSRWSWGTWDTQESQPIRYMPDLSADLRDLPGFREALARRTRNSATQCLCGDPIYGRTWGERMVRAGIHIRHSETERTLAAAAALNHPEARAMSTPTITAEQEAITRGWAVHRRACQAEWPEQGGRAIAVTLTDLHDALDLYSLILNGIIHPAWEWPELENEPEAFDLALKKAAQDVGEWADEMVRLLPASSEEGSGS